ncbi:hypothetical protein ACQRDF_07265 [Lachnospiraceae bacterium SGI.054]|nr:hypothetical protein [Eubacteriales bacterium]
MHTQNLCSARKTPKKFILSLVPTGGDEMDTLFLKKFLPLHLFEMGERFWGGVFKNIFEKNILSLIPTEKDGTATLFPKKFEARLFEPEKQKAPDCVIKCRNDIVSG